MRRTVTSQDRAIAGRQGRRNTQIRSLPSTCKACGNRTSQGFHLATMGYRCPIGPIPADGHFEVVGW